MIGVQTGGRRRGGWNTALPFCNGRRAVVSWERKEEPVEAKHGISVHQAQESSRPSNIPAGTDGAAGWLEHHVPEHGRGDAGIGSGGVRRARSRIESSILEESRSESVREVTRWLQPAQAEEGAQAHWTKRSRTAPVANRASRLNGLDLITPLPPSEQTKPTLAETSLENGIPEKGFVSRTLLRIAWITYPITMWQCKQIKKNFDRR
jgi:hypothetical protein